MVGYVTDVDTERDCSVWMHNQKMKYCPKYETWIHDDECDESKECYDLVDWASCVSLRRKVGRYAAK